MNDVINVEELAFELSLPAEFIETELKDQKFASPVEALAYFNEIADDRSSRNLMDVLDQISTEDLDATSRDELGVGDEPSEPLSQEILDLVQK